MRRFGWSDESIESAQVMAEARAEEALREAIAGGKVPRRELKVAYNGALGAPIREEVLARDGDCVITRNSYGARCLNTPDALFADVDFPTGPSAKLQLVLFLLLAPLAILSGWKFGGIAFGLGIMLAMFLGWLLARLVFHRQTRHPDHAHRVARQQLGKFLEAHPEWNVRVYRTPAGLRLLATHAPLPPEDSVVAEFFRAAGTDKLYVRMCRNQHCFRARLSAKPWRIGIESHMKPRPGVWPVRQERLAERAQWVSAYEARAASYAACSFLESLGSGQVHPKLSKVIELHDNEARATIPGMPIA